MNKMMMSIISILVLNMLCVAASSYSLHHMSRHGHKRRQKKENPRTSKMEKFMLVQRRSSSPNSSNTALPGREWQGDVNEKNDSSSDISHFPPCSLRFVHIGKCAGTSVERFVVQTRVPDAITFHHWAAFFEYNSLLLPSSLWGTALRNPGEFVCFEDRVSC